MRGQKTFKEIIKGGSLGLVARKGRNDKLVTKRNECLLTRYFYYGFYKNKCYEDILRMLVAEFFLSPHTIGQIILNNADELQAVKARATSMYYLQNMWPHLKW